MSSRRALLLVLAAIVAAVGWFALRGGPGGSGAARPDGARADDAREAAEQPLSPPAAGADAQGAGQAKEAARGTDAQADQRVAVGAVASIHGRPLDEIKAAARVVLANQPSKAASSEPAGSGAEAHTIEEAQREWRSFLEGKYADADQAAIDRARLDIEAILAWQDQGPFATPDEQLPKETREVLMRELQWLQER